MALPQFRSYVLVNNSGVTVDFSAGGRINIKETALNDDTTNGTINYNVLADDDLGFTAGTLADTAEIVGDQELDNTTNEYTSSQLQIEITHDGGTAADGTFDLYISAGVASLQLQTDASGYNTAETNKLLFIGSLIWESNGLNGEVMRSDIFHIG